MTFKSRIITQKVKDVLQKDLTSTLAIANDIVSLRKVAKRILPEVKTELGFEPKLETVTKIVERCVKSVRKTGKIADLDIRHAIRMLAKTRLLVQSDIGIVSFKFDDSIEERLVKIIRYICTQGRKPLINISFSHSYITIVVDECNLDKVIRIVGRKNVVYSKKNQAILTIVNPPEVLNIPGFAGYLFTFLGVSGINIKEIMSSYNEGILISDDKDVSEAYRILRNEINRLRKNYKVEVMSE